jgi:hypothetical protein
MLIAAGIIVSAGFAKRQSPYYHEWVRNKGEKGLFSSLSVASI